VPISREAAEVLAAWIHEQMQASVDPVFRQGQQRFFQHEVDSYGVRGDRLKQLSREVYRAVKPWPAGQRNRLMTALWKTGKLESGAIVCYVYRRFARQCAASEFSMFEKWVDRYVRNWAHTDGVASWLLAACIENEPDLRYQLRGWTKSPNRWKRRAAAVALLQEAKKARHIDFVFEIADALLDDRDDMVEKGVGWLLKETYPKSPRETVGFLMPRRARASRTTLRYAAEKMSARDRKEVLA
jgi:3-methyladenine DNA glycosylase AlkD